MPHRLDGEAGQGKGLDIQLQNKSELQHVAREAHVRGRRRRCVVAANPPHVGLGLGTTDSTVATQRATDQSHISPPTERSCSVLQLAARSLKQSIEGIAEPHGPLQRGAALAANSPIGPGTQVASCDDDDDDITIDSRAQHGQYCAVQVS